MDDSYGHRSNEIQHNESLQLSQHQNEVDFPHATQPQDLEYDNTYDDDSHWFWIEKNTPPEDSLVDSRSSFNSQALHETLYSSLSY